MPTYAPGGNTTTADLTNVLPTIISPAREYIEKKTFVTEFVTKVKLADGDGLSVNMPKFGQVLQAQALAENVPISNPQRLIPSTQQFTAGEVGCEVILTDRAIQRTPEAMMARAGRFIGNAMRRKKEEDIIALFAGFSRDLGAAGAAYSSTKLAAAYTRLSAGSEAGQDEPAPMPYAAILHPYHWYDVLIEADTIGSNAAPIPTGLTQRLSEDYVVQGLFGIPVDLHPLIPIDVQADAIGAVLSREALLLINTAHSMKREQERNIHLRAWDIVVTSQYGTGELEDQFGFAVTADATPPI